MAGLLTGTFVIEKIFSIPGLGKYFVDSIFNRDYPVIMGTTIFYSALLITCIFITDIIHRIVDAYSFYYVRRGCLDGGL